MKIAGCFAPDEDFDGQSYRRDWPGTNPNVAKDRALHPQPVLFTSPTTNGHNYQKMAFETDLPAIEAQGAQANPPFCNQTTGANCVNPPTRRAVLPVLLDDDAPRVVQLAGGRQIPAEHHQRLWRQLHD